MQRDSFFMIFEAIKHYRRLVYTWIIDVWKSLKQ